MDLSQLLTVAGLGALLKVFFDLMKKFGALKTEGPSTVGAIVGFALVVAFVVGWVTVGLTGAMAIESLVLALLASATALGIDTVGNAILAPAKV